MLSCYLIIFLKTSHTDWKQEDEPENVEERNKHSNPGTGTKELNYRTLYLIRSEGTTIGG
jgi:hypothetical protein